MTNIYKKFIEETGQDLRFTSWKFHRDLNKKQEKVKKYGNKNNKCWNVKKNVGDITLRKL